MSHDIQGPTKTLEALQYKTLLVPVLTSGVSKPTRYGAMMPVIAPMPFTIAIIVPA